jgi:general secretion pathway protein D
MAEGYKALRGRGWQILLVGLAAALGALQAWPLSGTLAAADSVDEAVAGQPAREGRINFSFDQVDIRTFVKLVGDVTGRKFSVADTVTGKITVVSPTVDRREVYPLFVTILEGAGYSVVEEGDLSRVVPLPERASPMPPVVGASDPLPAQGMITKVIRLQYVSAVELRKLLESKVGGGKTGAVGVIEETNRLIVTDTAESIRRVEKIVAEIDQPGSARTTEVVPLTFASADSMADELNRAMAEGATRGDRLRERLPAPEGRSDSGRMAAVVASPHSNCLILSGSASQVLELKRLIALMDVDTPAGRGRLNAVFLKYLSAEEAAQNINALLGKPAAGKDGAIPVAAPSRKISIEASLASNALLIDASPSDFEVVKKLVDQLDQPVPQVHIEVLIAELSEGENLNIGVEMAALDQPSGVGDSVVQGSSILSEGSESLLTAVQNQIFPGGISIGVAQGTSLNSDGTVVSALAGVININAIKKDSRFKIRSNPSLLAQNNREASVNIVEDIPILKSTIQGGSGTSRDVIQNIERMDVGIKLKLTPRIIPGGEVQMELNPSIEAVTDSAPGGNSLTPIVARREVSTTVTVRDAETIVIAGLTREDETSVVRKVPFLGSIPLIGWLFRHTVEGKERTNLLIFVTPRIVADSATAARELQRLQDQTGLKAHEGE